MSKQSNVSSGLEDGESSALEGMQPEAMRSALERASQVLETMDAERSSGTGGQTTSEPESVTEQLLLEEGYSPSEAKALASML